jgi:protein-L-isoaspartate(D-aspartate) O-methyltransferase
MRQRSGVSADLPPADAIYVCAGAAAPDRAWLDALRPGGRLLFPLAPEGVTGGMLLITRPEQTAVWPAKFVSGARFIGCVDLQDLNAARRLPGIGKRSDQSGSTTQSTIAAGTRATAGGFQRVARD